MGSLAFTSRRAHLDSPSLSCSCLPPLSVHRTLWMVERFYWWVGIARSMRWWDVYLVCQPPTVFSSVPGLIVGVGFSGPLPLTTCGCSHILVSTDYFCHCADCSLLPPSNSKPKTPPTSSSTYMYHLAGMPDSPPHLRPWRPVHPQTFRRHLRPIGNQHGGHLAFTTHKPKVERNLLSKPWLKSLRSPSRSFKMPGMLFRPKSSSLATTRSAPGYGCCVPKEVYIHTPAAFHVFPIPFSTVPI